MSNVAFLWLGLIAAAIGLVLYICAIGYFKKAVKLISSDFPPPSSDSTTK